MRAIELTQGTEAWHQFRASHFTASDAPAMMGASKYKTRGQLIKEKATGLVPEVTPEQQRIFDRGHAAEAAARPIAEKIIGADLFPATGECEAAPMLAASFDGITMDDSVIWEHKLINAELAKADAETLGEHYKIQLDQQLLVSGAEKCLFMASDGTEENCNWFWYYPQPERLARIVPGWTQFEQDVANYTPEPEEATAVGKAPESLPALRIQVTGMVQDSNLQEFKATAIAVFNGINRDLSTDQDFANAEKTVKWCKGVEDELAAAKKHALSQTASIDELFRAIDDISATARQTRLELDKLVKARKEAIREEIRSGAVKAFGDHIASLEKTFGGRIHMPKVPCDVASAMKGKKTMSSLRDAADTTVAQAKIAANEIADRIRLNLETLRADAKGYEFLFNDAQQLVEKENDDLKAVIQLRINEHKAAEEKRLEAERERIRQEEQQKLRREEDARAQREAAERRTAELAAQAEAAQDQPEEKAPTAVPETRSAARQPNTPHRVRPTDHEIIQVLAGHYRVGEEIVIGWLTDMNLEEASEQMVANL